jgi:hypothetical protein
MMDMARDRRGSTGPARNRHNRQRAMLEIASNMRPVDVETTAAILTPRLGLIGDSASFGTRFQGDAMRERILIVDDDPSLAAAAIAPPAALALLDGKGHVRALADIEAEAIRFAISHYRGQMSEIARRLHIGRSTLYRKLDSLGLDAEISDGKAPALQSGDSC